MILTRTTSSKSKGVVSPVEMRLFGPISRDEMTLSYLEKIITTSDLDLLEVLRNLEPGCLGTILISMRSTKYIWTDHICSIPLFYNSSTLEITDNLRHNADYDISREQIDVFKSSGFTAPGTTIYSAWKRTEPECVYSISDKINKFKRTKKKLQIPHDLSEIVSNIFDDIVSRSKGRKIWIPLSGGYDSIFILLEISKRTENYACFTYGPTVNKEMENAEYVTTILNSEWHKVPLVDPHVPHLTGWPDIESYLLENFNGFTTPPINDVYQIEQLKKDGYIVDGDTIINGQSGDFATGGHDYEENESSIDTYMAKHHNISKNRIQSCISKIRRDIEISVRSTPIKDELYCREKYWRQSSLVIQGQCAYTRHNLNWELPLWDKNFVEYFESLPATERYEQYFYKKYLAQRYPEVFGNFTQKRTTNFLGVSGFFLRILVKVTLSLNRNADFYYKLGAFTGHYSDHIKLLGLKRYISDFSNVQLPAGRIVLYLSNKIILEKVDPDD